MRDAGATDAKSLYNTTESEVRLRRPLLDLGSQSVPILSQLIERIFLTALLVQRLGVAQFERWSLISATMTLLTMVDLGTQITFSNRMSRAAHRGDIDQAVAIFRQSNSIFALLGMLVMGLTTAVAMVAPLQIWLGMNPPLDAGEQLVALCLGGAIAVKLAATNSSGVYRANMAFGWGTVISSGGDLLRIGVSIAALVVFRSMTALAVAMLLATVIANVIVIPIDVAKRFPRFAWSWRRPEAITTHRALRESILFASGFLPSIVLTQVPILMIGSRAAQGVLAGYVLLRTIANTVRSLSQRVTFILGMELSRLETQSRHDELQASYRKLATLIAFAFGVGCALLWAWGGVLLHLWAGSGVVYDPLLLAIMLAPLVIVPGLQLNLPLLTYGHRPGSFAIAVVAQTIAAALLALFLPINSMTLRLSLALSIAEVVFMAPIITLAARRMIGPAATRGVLPDLLIVISAGAVTLALSLFVQRLSGGKTGLLVASVVTALVAGPILLFLMRRLIPSKEIVRD